MPETKFLNGREELPLSPLELAVIRTVCYSSIFRFPLKEEELRHGLVGEQLTGRSPLEIYRKSPRLQRVIDHQGGYFFPRGCSSWVATRRNRRKITLRALRRYRFPLRLICHLPFTRLVALSGSAAFYNMDKEGDIDLFLVTHPGRVWMTAVLILVVLRLLRCRPAICFNFLLSERELKLRRCDFFAAGQTGFLIPLIGHEVYRRLLAENPQVYEFYPNLEKPGADQIPLSRTARASKRLLERLLQTGPAFLLERLSRYLYRRHLLAQAGGWESPEEVILEPECLKLHTRSHRKRVLAQFERRLTQAVSIACAPLGREVDVE